MRGQVPNGVYVFSDGPQVCSVGFEMLNFTKLSRIDDFLELKDGGVEEKYMANDDGEISFFGNGAQLGTPVRIAPERFFHKDVLPRF